MRIITRGQWREKLGRDDKRKLAGFKEAEAIALENVHKRGTRIGARADEPVRIDRHRSDGTLSEHSVNAFQRTILVGALHMCDLLGRDCRVIHGYAANQKG
jgi:hypothetical protein